MATLETIHYPRVPSCREERYGEGVTTGWKSEYTALRSYVTWRAQGLNVWLRGIPSSKAFVTPPAYVEVKDSLGVYRCSFAGLQFSQSTILWRFSLDEKYLIAPDPTPVSTQTVPEGTVEKKNKFRLEKWGKSRRIYEGDRFICTLSSTRDNELAETIVRLLNTLNKDN